MAKELVLIPQKRYEELLQNKQTEILPKHETKDDLTVDEVTEREQCVKETLPVQTGKGLIVRKKRSMGKGLPGIANRCLRKIKSNKSTKKKKTKIQWIKF